MPKVFADQQAHAFEARVESADRITPGEEASLVEESVGGQVDLVMDVEEAAS
jgi:hypothetical protein